MSLCVVVSVSLQERIMILLLSGIWDLRPHVTVNVVSTKEIFLNLFQRRTYVAGRYANQQEDCLENTWLIFKMH